MGKITMIQARMYRNTPHGKPQWSRPIRPDMTPENIVWRSFLGEAPQRAFDANRYLNWRFFWDYSGGNVFENMCHQLSFWYKALDLSIPTSVTMTGGLYVWKDGREVPDTMNVSMVHSKEEMLFTWDSGFGNERLSITEDVLGTDGTISRTPQTLKYLPEKKNRPDGTEMAGMTRSDPKAHMINFMDSMRNRDYAQLPVRSRLPHCDRLPHGRRELPPSAHHALGRREGRDRLRRTREFRIHRRAETAPQSRP